MCPCVVADAVPACPCLHLTCRPFLALHCSRAEPESSDDDEHFQKKEGKRLARDTGAPACAGCRHCVHGGRRAWGGWVRALLRASVLRTRWFSASSSQPPAHASRLCVAPPPPLQPSSTQSPSWETAQRCSTFTSSPLHPARPARLHPRCSLAAAAAAARRAQRSSSSSRAWRRRWSGPLLPPTLAAWQAWVRGLAGGLCCCCCRCCSQGLVLCATCHRHPSARTRRCLSLQQTTWCASCERWYCCPCSTPHSSRAWASARRGARSTAGQAGALQCKQG